MRSVGILRIGLLAASVVSLSACSGGLRLNPGQAPDSLNVGDNPTVAEQREQSTIWDLFRNIDDPAVTIEVNKYLWNASLDVLNFLPVQSVDPFSGIIVTGFGTPPGGGRAYRATVFVQDPALEARSLKVALATRNGPVSTETQRAVEDAILTRARQLRIRDERL